MKILSWNVNGLRAVQKKGFADWVRKARPDMLCLQESRALPEQVEPDWPRTFEAHWNPAEKKGYSGVLTFSKPAPLNVTRGIGIAEHDREGRVLTTEYDDFFLVSTLHKNKRFNMGDFTFARLNQFNNNAQSMRYFLTH